MKEMKPPILNTAITKKTLMHTFVPEILEGRGIASSLAHHALEWAREHKKPVVVYCPYVATYLKRHPEYNEVIDKNYIG